MNQRQSDKIEFTSLIFFTIFLLIGLLLTGCGKDSHTEITETITCVVQNRTMVCSDGINYELPDDEESVEEPTQVEVEPTPEKNPEAICEKNNRNKRKCVKVKKDKK